MLAACKGNQIRILISNEDTEHFIRPNYRNNTTGFFIKGSGQKGYTIQFEEPLKVKNVSVDGGVIIVALAAAMSTQHKKIYYYRMT